MAVSPFRGPVSNLPPIASQPFALVGRLSPLRKAAQARRSRPMGGWLATYGKIGPTGGIIPTTDRDDQVFEAARSLGQIDWSAYQKGGRWNDTHNEAILVGIPTSLEFHPETSDLAKSHGKVGFFTTGHLFDRADPGSWEGLGRRPTGEEFQRADYFWGLANLLKGEPRTLALSAHGLMATAPDDKSRIVFAIIRQAAVCEVPVNPDATLEILEHSRSPSLDSDDGLAVLAAVAAGLRRRFFLSEEDALQLIHTLLLEKSA